MKMKFEEVWNDFLAQVINRDALSPESVEKLKQVFYCGAYALDNLYREILKDGPSEETRTKIRAIWAEISSYATMEDIQ